MSYVTGFVLAVPTARKEEYRDHADRAWEIFRDYDAAAMWECWGDDVPEGRLTSFPMAVKKRPDETVMFSWIEWPDKATSERCFGAMEADPRFAALGELPFDGSRMFWGGFAPLLVRRA